VPHFSTVEIKDNEFSRHGELGNEYRRFHPNVEEYNFTLKNREIKRKALTAQKRRINNSAEN
jgi:hypothetical protein